MNRKKEEEGNTMNKMIGSLRSTLTKTLVLSAFALSLLVTSAVSFANQESGGEQQRRRHPNELTFTQIDVPGATITLALGINNRDQIVGIYIEESGAQHGFLLDDGLFAQLDFRAPSVPHP
jgi:hypothetical protein